jgi:hypothetical protein
MYQDIHRKGSREHTDQWLFPGLERLKIVLSRIPKRVRYPCVSGLHDALAPTHVNRLSVHPEWQVGSFHFNSWIAATFARTQLFESMSIISKHSQVGRVMCELIEFMIQPVK